jgi:hypothetical protein
MRKNKVINFTLQMEAVRSSESSVLTRAKWRLVPDDIRHHLSSFQKEILPNEGVM